MLLLDAGNRALKCLQVESGERCRFDWNRDWLWNELSDWFQEQGEQPVWLASVASAALTARLRASWDSLYPGQPMRQLHSPRQLDGLVNAYDEPERLGVDRWLALLAAWQNRERDALVIDAGSAITLDLLSRRHGHLGGAILPGLNTNPRRFAELFPQIDFTDPGLRCAEEPGRNTRDCLCPLPPDRVIPQLQHCLEQWRGLLQEPVEILLGGGDAEQLAARLELPVRIEPDLVFAGMLRQIELNPDGVPG